MLSRTARIMLFEKVDSAKERMAEVILAAEDVALDLDNEEFTNMIVTIESWEVAIEHMIIPDWLALKKET